MSSVPNITELLTSWRSGDLNALDLLAPLVEKELQRLAHSFMRKERQGHILETTALVNEAFIGLINQDRIQWQNRAHFFGIAGQLMRRILSNYARDQRRLKRGGGAFQVSLSDRELTALLYVCAAYGSRVSSFRKKPSHQLSLNRGRARQRSR